MATADRFEEQAVTQHGYDDGFANRDLPEPTRAYRIGWLRGNIDYLRSLPDPDEAKLALRRNWLAELESDGA